MGSVRGIEGAPSSAMANMRGGTFSRRLAAVAGEGTAAAIGAVEPGTAVVGVGVELAACSGVNSSSAAWRRSGERCLPPGGAGGARMTAAMGKRGGPTEATAASSATIRQGTEEDEISAVGDGGVGGEGLPAGWGG